MVSLPKPNLLYLLRVFIFRIYLSCCGIWNTRTIHYFISVTIKWRVYLLALLWIVMLMIYQVAEEEPNIEAELEIMVKHTRYTWALEDMAAKAQRDPHKGEPSLEEELDLMVKRTKHIWALEDIITKARRARYRDVCAWYKDEISFARPAFIDVLHNSEIISANPEQITMLAHMTEERLPVLLRQLKHWQAPMSVSVYINLENLKPFFLNLIRHLDPGRNNIQIHAIPRRPGLYPSNYLRNVALNATVTRYVFANDIDFVPSSGAHDVLLEHRMQCNTCQVLVVPAFEEMTNDTDVARSFPSSKQELVDMWNASAVSPFHLTQFAPGHQPTDFERWKETNETYNIRYSEYFEPYVVADLKRFPRFNEHFLGRFYDKSSQLMEVYAKKFEFVVVPDVFLIHIWHPIAPRSSKEYMCSHRLYEEHKSMMLDHFNGPIC